MTRAGEPPEPPRPPVPKPEPRGADSKEARKREALLRRKLMGHLMPGSSTPTITK